jgi:hypothetical protein
MPKHSLYFSEKMFERLDIDRDGPEGLSTRISSLCETAIELMRDSVPAMPLKEWQATLSILNGVMHPHEFGARAVADSVYYSILESGPDVNEQFEVDAVDMAKRFKVLPLASQLAVVEVCRRFWVRKDINDRFESYRDMLDAHGAKFTD